MTDVPEFAGAQSKLFRKMGMDLIETLPDGRAAVHIPASRIEQLLATMRGLPSATDREKSRWINFDAFEQVEWFHRVDEEWLDSLGAGEPIELAIKFQPTLTRTEVQDLLQAVAGALATGERLLSAGREFSGRYWCAGLVGRQTIERLATEFPSIQSLIARSTTPVAGKGRAPRGGADRSPPSFSTLPALPVAQLPTVAVLDTGIPEQHALLAPYRRSGYRNPGVDPTVQYMGDHGSVVASCVAFGRVDLSTGVPAQVQGTCRVMDVMVGKDPEHIDDDIVVTALDTVIATAPDVRVFNLSFGGPPISSFAPTKLREELIKLQDLDNLAFARDILLVIAAGNTPPGLAPQQPYPRHLDDERWALGTHARSFNGAVCGAYVDVVGAESVAGIIGAPSPFTRIGPGLGGSPVPGFGAPGGDALENYHWAPGTGIGACTASAMWEDRGGTSVAAPLVAREAAWMFQELALRCGGQTIPFAGTVKAWMALVAQRPKLMGQYERLASRTLGLGLPRVERLRTPADRSAVFVWQVVLQGPKAVSRVQVPVPLPWLHQASSPRFRAVAAWNTPVNAALSDLWGCRKVSIKVRPFGAAAALLGGGTAHGSYPLIDRTFDISSTTLAKKNFEEADAEWVLECEYEEVGEYPPAMEISNQQRVGVVVELWDDGEQPTSPQPFIQALPVALELDRLSVLQQPFEVPVTIRQ